jgi:hypothetical protein
MIQYSILINTCDKFEDCWDPFFKLFKLYWPDCKGKIYLNTEYKDYSYPGLNIIAVKGCQKHHLPHNKRATWSQCLKWALEEMETDIVLYMQEDYFLKDYVKNGWLEHYVQLMQEYTAIKCIQLTDQAVKASGGSSYENLNKVAYKQRYRISCQASLWRKEELLSLIREYENAWEFEEFGSQRSALIRHEYLVVDKKFVVLNQYEIIPYIFTGIIQGRWYKETVPLFKKHGIDMDYSKRGFASEQPQKSLMNKIKYRLNKIPKIIRCKIDLYNLQRKGWK